MHSLFDRARAFKDKNWAGKLGRFPEDALLVENIVEN